MPNNIVTHRPENTPVSACDFDLVGITAMQQAVTG